MASAPRHLPPLVRPAAPQRPRVACCDEERRERRGAERQCGGAVDGGRAADADQGGGWVVVGWWFMVVTLWLCQKLAIENGHRNSGFSIQNGGSFHSYVKLPEGISS